VSRSKDGRVGKYDEVPRGELIWAIPAAVVHQMPSMRLHLTLTSSGATRAELGRYVLEHSA
jgi:hypothetical protein